MIYHFEQNLLKSSKEGVVRTEIGSVILRLEVESFRLGTKILVFDKYHVRIGQISKGMFKAGHNYVISYDDRVVAFIKKKRFLWRKKLVLNIIDHGDFTIKGDLQSKEFVIQRKGQIYARISKKLVDKNNLFGLETKDSKLKYYFLCVAVIATL